MEEEVKRGRVLPSILAFLLGLIFGIIIVVGALIGVGVYATKMKIADLPGNSDGNGKYVYINGDASSGGAEDILDLINKLSSMVKSIDQVTIGDVKGLLPMVQKILDEFNDATDEYLLLQEGELEAVKVVEFKIWLSHLIEKINVIGIIKPKTDSTIVSYLCYKITGIRSDPETGKYKANYKDGNGVVHECTLKLDENGVIVGASYEDDGAQFEVPVVGINDLQSRINGLMNDLTIGEIIPDIPENDMLLGAIKDSTINSLSDDLQKIAIQQLFADDVYKGGNAAASTGGTAKMYLAVSGSPEVATGYDENLIYYTDSAGQTLADCNGKLTQETYDKLMGEGTLYTAGEGKIIFNSEFVYYVQNETGAYKLINAGTQFAGRAEYQEGLYTYGACAPLWRILLYSTVAAGDSVDQEEVYTLNDVNKMITNVTKNTQHTYMRDLHKAGILTFSNEEQLEYELYWYESGDPLPKHKPIGDMTLMELVGIVVVIAQTSNPSQP